MIGYFPCDLCDKSIKIRSERKHSNSQYHKSLTGSIICKYTVKISNFFHVEDILKNFVDDYNEKFEFFKISCEWKLLFSDTIFNFKSDRLYNIHRAGCNLKRNLRSKIEYFESNGHKLSHISEMNIVFTKNVPNTTYEHYLKIPKPMIESTTI